jgi:hypothetical protein
MFFKRPIHERNIIKHKPFIYLNALSNCGQSNLFCHVVYIHSRYCRNKFLFVRNHCQSGCYLLWKILTWQYFTFMLLRRPSHQMNIIKYTHLYYILSNNKHNNNVNDSSRMIWFFFSKKIKIKMICYCQFLLFFYFLL